MLNIIIPTFNRLSWLKECLRHLNEQKCRDVFEVIVVDDGSTDGTNKYLSKSKSNFRFKLVFLSQKNRGPASARNYGISASGGNIVAFIDDDSMTDPNWASEILKSFRSLPSTCAAVKGKTKMHGYSDFGAFLQKHFDDSDSWITNNIAYRKEVFMQIGLFDEKYFSLAAWEDLDFGYRALRSGYKRYYNEKAIVYHPREESFQQLMNRYRVNGYGFYQFARKWMREDPIFICKILFWELTKIHYMLPFMKHFNYAKYLAGLRLAYQINGLLQGIRLRGNFRIKTRDIT